MRLDVPYHQQRLEFSCGPACLIMAMQAHDDRVDPSLAHEITIWREATIAAVPATSAQGLALAAHRRGFRARVVSSTEGLAFRNRIDEMMEKFLNIFYEDALDILFDDLKARTRTAGIPTEIRTVTEADLEHALANNEVPIILSDTAVLGDPWDPIPHWIVVTGMDAENVYVNNPLEEHEGAVKNEVYPREKFRKALGFFEDTQGVMIGPRFGRADAR